MQSGNLVKAEFFTTTHRITGEVETGLKPLSDLLNDKAKSFLLVFNVYLSPLDEPATIRDYTPVAYLSKENLSFVIVPARETRTPDRGRFSIQRYETVATTAGFEVRGEFVGPHRIDLWSFSPATLDPFVALTEGTARLAAAPEVTFSGEAILINRERLECFCLTE